MLTRPERLTLVDWDGESLPIKTQAELLSLNRSGLYYQPLAPSPEEVALKHRIDVAGATTPNELYTLRPFYGSRRITATLRRGGVAAQSESRPAAHAGDGHRWHYTGTEP